MNMLQRGSDWITVFVYFVADWLASLLGATLQPRRCVDMCGGDLNGL